MQPNNEIVVKDAHKIIESKLTEFLLKEATSAEKFVDPAEQFANFLPITLGDKKVFDFDEQQLTSIRDFSRILCTSDEICKNILKHYQNHIVGSGIKFIVLPREGNEKNPKDIAKSLEDSKIKKMTENWEAFRFVNKMDMRERDWINRAHRDGEVFLRIFNAKVKYGGLSVPTVRFIDPYNVKDKGEDARLGIYKDEDDNETIEGYNYKIDDTEKKIPADEVIHDRRNVDMDTPRGFSSFWAVFTNIRRAEKNMTNVSVLTSILSAIALVRKHAQATQSKIQTFLSSNSDGKSRTNAVSGNTQYARHLGSGTVIDAPVGVEYEFPAHTVQSKNYLDVVDKELACIAAAFVLPVEWLKTAEPTEPLNHGSPVIANFKTEQAIIFHHEEDLFWKVQELMGVKPEARLKYKVTFFGPVLATGKALDQTRISEIQQRCGVLSPQTWCAQEGRDYTLERANTIKHRETAQPGEVMPGDAGNTNVEGGAKAAGQGGDGVSKDGASKGTSGKDGSEKDD